MPSRWITGHTPSFGGSIPGSAASSRPSSRASSPVRGASTNRPGNVSVPSRRRDGTVDSTDPLIDYFSNPHGAPTPAYETPSIHSATTPSVGSMWGNLTPGYPSGAITPGGGHLSHHPVEIILDSDHLVLRGQGGDMNPAYLSGRVELNLHESTNIKEITMHMVGKAKVHFADGYGSSTKTHNFTHTVASHDWSFLQGAKGHSHTLKAGYHSFPFSFMLDGNLPSTLKTYAGDAIIAYKLRATVVRSGFASNFAAQKDFTLARMFTPEALEFNQTLEIENTWPGKVMYSITLPFKAYAAGDDIPVNVKFMPLAKGVRVTQVVSVVKEYTLVHTRHSSHPDTRVAACVKHELRDGRAVEVASEPVRPPNHWIEAFKATHGAHTPLPGARAVSGTQGARPSDSYFPAAPQNDAAQGSSSGAGAGAGPSSSSGHTDEEEVDIDRLIEQQAVGDGEVNTSFSIPIPTWATPSHSIHPVFVTHKLKWSCSIANPDGHISELRCALPILILANELLDEARSAGASTRGLLFGGSGDEPTVDLPSYNNHVYDRIAIADSGSATGFIPRSVNATPLPSPHDETPPSRSRPPSRPASPTRGYSHASGVSTSSRGTTDFATPAGEVPPRRQLSQWADSELLLSLGALSHSNGSSPNATPPDSRAPSRPLSRRNSRSGGWGSRPGSKPGSRAGSRASSPERSQSSSVSGTPAEESHVRPGTERRSTGGFHGLFHLPLKPIKPLSNLGSHHLGNRPILRNGSHTNLATSPVESNFPRRGSSNTLNTTGSGSGSLPDRNHVSFAPHVTRVAASTSADHRRNGNGEPRFSIEGPETPDEEVPHHHPHSHSHTRGEDEGDDEEEDPISRVPSYAIASRGFLGGGVVPIDVGLPTYDASEQLMQRTKSGTDLLNQGLNADEEDDEGGLMRNKSDTALIQLGAQAAVDAEERAAIEAGEIHL